MLIYNLKSNFSLMDLNTEYSGMDFPALAFRFIAEAGTVRGHEMFPPRYHSACDISKAARKVLASSRSYPMHTFSDMFHRLPDSVNLACEQAAPYKDMKHNDPAMAQQQFKVIRAIQDAYYFGPTFNRNVRCKCDTHGGALCPVYPPLSSENQRLSVMISGLECVDFTPYGSQLKLGGDSTRKLALWLAERRINLEDVIIAECWRDFPYDEIAKAHRSFEKLCGLCQRFVLGSAAAEPHVGRSGRLSPTYFHPARSAHQPIFRFGHTVGTS
jgi:hypothetical protein